MKFLETKIKDVDDCFGSIESWICYTELKRNPYYIEIYIFWSKLFVMELIPYIGIISMNSWIIYAIFKPNNLRKDAGGQGMSI